MAVDVSGRRPLLGIAALVLSLLVGAPNLSEAQSGCTYHLFWSDLTGGFSPNHAGGTSFVLLATRTGCVIRFSMAPNPDLKWRSATLSVGTSAMTFWQSGAPRVADINGDGNTDIFWQHASDGRIGAWLMNNVRRITAVKFSPAHVPDTNWTLAGGGDLNPDGHLDLVWRHTDGRVAAWLMNRLQLRSAELLSIPVVADAEWRIRSVFDLDADGHADLLWQHQTQGLVGIWYMNGLRVRDARLVSGPVVTDSNWVLVGASPNGYGGGFDPALIWHHRGTGNVAAWRMRGSTVISADVIGGVADTNWKLVGLPDLNWNAIADFLWRSGIDGRVNLWLDGTTRNSVEYTPVPDPNWRIAGPR